MNDIEQQELKKENESLKEEIRLLKKKTELLSITQPLNKLSQFLIDRMDAIIFIKDVTNDFRYFMVNQNFCILQNTPHHKIIGKNDYEIFTPDVAEKYRRDDKITINRKGEYTFQEEICVPGQKKVILQTTKSYVSTSEGNKLLVCIGYDITKAVEKEIKLKNAIKVEQEAHQMMRAIFHELPSAILIKDIEDDYRFYIINKKFEQMCNLPKELLIGKTDYEVFPKDEADKYRRDDTEASRYSEDAPLIINEIVTSPDRDVTTHLQTAKFSFSFKGKKLLVCVGNDVTLQHQMMEQLKNALDKAKQADRLKAQFISNMSHEIRTPLNAIVGFSQLIADATSKEEQEEYQRIVMLNNNLLLTLIEDVLNLSVLDSGKMTFNNTVFNLSEMFGDLAIQMKDKVKLPGREFIYEVPLQEVQVKADKERLTQIVTNLITNAAKFTRQGYIKMGYALKDSGVEIYVKDTGIGIAPDKVGHIFDRFVKLNSFAQGTGLGLAICRMIIEKIGGEIGATSEVGKGSTFFFTIPYKEHSDDRIAFSEVSETKYISHTIKRVQKIKKILVAEDVDSNFVLIKNMIGKDYTLLWAKDGFEAVEMYKQFQPDLILMDIKMPRMGGLEATRIIRSYSKEIPVIALTAYAFEADKEQALEAGCNDFVTKPVSKAALEEALGKCSG